MLAKVFTGVRFEHAKNVPLEGPVILAANHQSFFDPPLVGAGVSPVLSFLARDTLFDSKILGPLIRNVNAYPVRRGGSDVGSFKQCLRLLKEGRHLVLFPEGTRTSTGRIRPMQAGVIGLARKSNAVIVPVLIEGAFELWPRHARLPRPARVNVEYEEPMLPNAFEGLSNTEAAGMLTSVMREQHNRLRERLGRHPFNYSDDNLMKERQEAGENSGTA